MMMLRMMMMNHHSRHQHHLQDFDLNRRVTIDILARILLNRILTNEAAEFILINASVAIDVSSSKSGIGSSKSASSKASFVTTYATA